MHDVAIVGYGPVGATLAGLLGKLGVDVLVFDKNHEIYPKPRAVGFDHDAMRIFQRIGISEAISPYIEPFREEIYLGADGQVLQHFKHMPKPYPLTWDPHFKCDQPGIERELRNQIAGMPNVQVNLGYTLHSYRHRWGHAPGDTRYADDELRMNPAPVLTVPTWVLHGAADGVNHPDTSLGKEAFFSGPYERVLLAGAGHFPQREVPDDMLTALHRFFETSN